MDFSSLIVRWYKKGNNAFTSAMVNLMDFMIWRIVRLSGEEMVKED